MNAGDLDRRVGLYSRSSPSQDAQGQPVEVYTLFATVWAQKINPSARQFFAAQQQNWQLVTQFRIRYRTDVTVRTQLVCDGVTYLVTALSEIGRKEGLALACEQVFPHAS